MIALAVGTALALLALSFVLLPLFGEPRTETASTPLLGFHGEAEAITALREVEFDRETGKLSDGDYASLKATYTREAVAALRAQSELAASSPDLSDGDVEAVILRHRMRQPACTACGPQPESDALYCSTCGTYLPGSCGRCGVPVAEPAARFCASCGNALAA